MILIKSVSIIIRHIHFIFDHNLVPPVYTSDYIPAHLRMLYSSYREDVHRVDGRPMTLHFYVELYHGHS